MTSHLRMHLRITEWSEYTMWLTTWQILQGQKKVSFLSLSSYQH